MPLLVELSNKPAGYIFEYEKGETTFKEIYKIRIPEDLQTPDTEKYSHGELRRLFGHMYNVYMMKICPDRSVTPPKTTIYILWQGRTCFIKCSP